MRDLLRTLLSMTLAIHAFFGAWPAAEHCVHCAYGEHAAASADGAPGNRLPGDVSREHLCDHDACSGDHETPHAPCKCQLASATAGAYLPTPKIEFDASASLVGYLSVPDTHLADRDLGVAWPALDPAALDVAPPLKIHLLYQILVV